MSKNIIRTDNLTELEMNRLESKYKKALNITQCASELNISKRTLQRRIESNIDLPMYKEQTVGGVLFPLSSVAQYLTSGLVQTA